MLSYEARTPCASDASRTSDAPRISDAAHLSDAPRTEERAQGAKPPAHPRPHPHPRPHSHSRSNSRPRSRSRSHTRRPWIVATVAALAIVTAGAFMTLAGLLVGPLHEEFGWSRSTIGVGTLVAMVVYGGTAPFAAALMDRFGLRLVAGGALLLVGAGAGLTATMTRPWQFVLYWGVLVGLGTGACAMAFAASVTERWFVARRGLVTGLLTAASVLGQFAFLPVLSQVIEGFGWRTAALGLMVAAGGALLLVVVLLRDHPADLGGRPYGAQRFVPRPVAAPGSARRALRTLRRAAGTAPFWLLTGTFAVCGASTNGVMWTHFEPAAHDHGMPVTVAASLLSLVGIFNVAGTVGSGWLTDRFDARRLLAGYYAARGLSLLLLPLLLSDRAGAPLVTFAVVFGLLDVATVPPTIALCRRFYGGDAAVVFGWVSAGHQVGAGAVAFAGGLLRDSLGSYDAVWAAVGVLCAGAALLAMTVTRATSPSAASPGRVPGPR